MTKAKLPRLPLELRAVESQLARKDGRLRFRVRFEVQVVRGKENVYGCYPRRSFHHVRGKVKTWSCNTVDELLWAIERVIQDLENSPGVQREDAQVGMPEACRCPKCGQNTGGVLDHKCLEGVRTMQALHKYRKEQRAKNEILQKMRS